MGGGCGVYSGVELLEDILFMGVFVGYGANWELGFGVYGGGGRWFSFGFPDYLVKVFLDFSSSSSFSNSFYPIFWVSFLLIEQI